jgi:transposase
VTVIRERVLLGEKLSAIGVSLGLSRNTVKDIAHNRTWSDPEYTPPKRNVGNRPALTREQVAEARLLWTPRTSPGTIKELAKKFGVAYGTMYRALNHRGIYES